MIVGAHSILYSVSPVADRAFLRDVLKLTHVDVGDGWLIFGLPPSEVAVHPAESNDEREFYLMCDDVGALVKDMEKRRIRCGPIQDQGYGLFTRITLPGGGKLDVYQPRHARPKAMPAPESRKKPASLAKKTVRKPAKKTSMKTTKKKVRRR
jgi:hypothetical protein